MMAKNTEQRRIGIFGGAFDPPHFGHMWVVSCLLNSGEVDEIWLVPSGSRRDKKTIAPGWARFEMLDKIVASCFQGDARLQICSAEIEEGSTIEGSVELLEELKNRAEDADFKLIIGADLVPQLPNWRQQQQLKRCQFLVVARPDTLAEKPEGFLLKEVTTPILLDISASQLRSMLSNQDQVAGLMPREVEDLAREHYRKPENPVNRRYL